MTEELLNEIVDVIANVRDEMRDKIAALESRLAANTLVSNTELLDRIEALEARPMMKYCGVYEAGRTYHEGEVITDHGCAWICVTKDTTIRPAFASDASSRCWRLMVKAGRDGKDLR
jgi:hypothetical protein